MKPNALYPQPIPVVGAPIALPAAPHLRVAEEEHRWLVVGAGRAHKALQVLTPLGRAVALGDLDLGRGEMG